MNDVDWHRLPPLTTLRAFEATGRLGGYSAAARSLNVTTAAIAQQVRKLETELGVVLVRRAGRGLSMTPAGRELATTLNKAFSQIADGIDDVLTQDANRGVRVSTTIRFVDAVIMPNLSAFWTDHPGVQVSFSPEQNDKNVDLEAFDIVIRGGPPGQTWEGAAQTQLLRTPFVICGTPELITSASSNLASVPWINDDSIGGHVFEGILKGLGCDLNDLKLIDPGGAKFELEAALLGYGLHISPELTVSKHLDSGALEKMDIPLDWAAYYYAIYSKRLVSARVQAFLDWLVSICAGLSSKPDAP